MARRILQILLPVLLLALGAGGMRYMVSKRPKAKRQKAAKPAMVVDVVQLAAVQHKVTLSGQGTVAPERTIVVQPQVSGVIIEESPALQDGGRVKKGEVLARIDPRDYRLQVRLREADVERAKFEVKLEKGRRSVAQREWKLLDGTVKSTADGKNLALRQPHKARVDANLGAAMAALEAAMLNLQRTTIKAPFDAVVRQKRASIGQLVSPATPIATLVQADRFLVQVSVPLAHLSWIRVPGLNAEAGQGADVVISYEAGGGKRALRKGKVERLLGDLDPAGRMARVVVAVDQPLQVQTEAPSATGVQTGDRPPTAAKVPTIPLLLGSYVRADIEGRQLAGVYRVPMTAVREGDKVWLASKDDRLVVRPLEVIWRERDAVLVRGGLESRGLQDGDRVIISRVPSAVPGMALKPRDVSSGAPGDKPMAKATAKPKRRKKPGNTGKEQHDG